MRKSEEKALFAQIDDVKREIKNLERQRRLIDNRLILLKSSLQRIISGISKLALKERKLLKEELMARHMWKDWWETDSPQTEIASAVSFHSAA